MALRRSSNRPYFLLTLQREIHCLPPKAEADGSKFQEATRLNTPFLKQPWPMPSYQIQLNAQEITAGKLIIR